VHGGVRYLEKAVFNIDPAQLKLVYEALRERSDLLANAPHLAHPLPILMPCYKYWEVPFYWVGLKMYDLVAGGWRPAGGGRCLLRLDPSLYGAAVMTVRCKGCQCSITLRPPSPHPRPHKRTTRQTHRQVCATWAGASTCPPLNRGGRCPRWQTPTPGGAHSRGR